MCHNKPKSYYDKKFIKIFGEIVRPEFDNTSCLTNNDFLSLIQNQLLNNNFDQAFQIYKKQMMTNFDNLEKGHYKYGNHNFELISDCLAMILVNLMSDLKIRKREKDKFITVFVFDNTKRVEVGLDSITIILHNIEKNYFPNIEQFKQDCRVTEEYSTKYPKKRVTLKFNLRHFETCDQLINILKI